MWTVGRGQKEPLRHINKIYNSSFGSPRHQLSEKPVEKNVTTLSVGWRFIVMFLGITLGKYCFTYLEKYSFPSSGKCHI